MSKDLTERVYKQIKRDIMLGSLPDNVLFSEQYLADRYACSRTPAREAAGRLAMEGFLNKYPSKGYCVRQLTQKEMREVRYTCYTLEMTALELIVHTAYGEDITNLYDLIDSRPDDAESAVFANLIFHCEVARLSGNDVMARIIESLQCRMLRGDVQPLENPYDFLGENRRPVRDEPMSDQYHRALVDALVRRDLEGAKRALTLDYYPLTAARPTEREETDAAPQA